MQLIPKEITLALKTIEDSGNEAYIVGGAVRNMLLGTKVVDYDITTSAHPNTIKQLFSAYNQYTAGKKYGTVVVLIGDYKIDITTFRQDTEYKDHRHPISVEFTNSLLEDIKRRDFTINAMCLDMNNNLIDYFNGVDDLNNKIIKAIGDPNTRFNEDALRILRAIKFATRLGFEIESNTKKAMFDNARLLNLIANERKKDELLQILSYPNKQKYINDYLSVFNTFIPFKEVDEKINNFLDPYFSLGYLLSKTSGYNLKELKFSGQEINLLNDLVLATNCDIDNDYDFINTLSSIHEKEIYNYLRQLHNKDLSEKYHSLNPFIVDLNTLKISGNDLMELGYHDKNIKEIKNKLIDEIKHQKLINDHDSIKKYLKNTVI